MPEFDPATMDDFRELLDKSLAATEKLVSVLESITGQKSEDAGGMLPIPDDTDDPFAQPEDPDMGFQLDVMMPQQSAAPQLPIPEPEPPAELPALLPQVTIPEAPSHDLPIPEPEPTEPGATSHDAQIDVTSLPIPETPLPGSAPEMPSLETSIENEPLDVPDVPETQAAEVPNLPIPEAQLSATEPECLDVPPPQTDVPSPDTWDSPTLTAIVDSPLPIPDTPEPSQGEPAEPLASAIVDNPLPIPDAPEVRDESPNEPLTSTIVDSPLPIPDTPEPRDDPDSEPPSPSPVQPQFVPDLPIPDLSKIPPGFSQSEELESVRIQEMQDDEQPQHSEALADQFREFVDAEMEWKEEVAESLQMLHDHVRDLTHSLRQLQNRFISDMHSSGTSY